MSTKNQEIMGIISNLVGVLAFGILLWLFGKVFRNVLVFWNSPPHHSLSPYYLLLSLAVVGLVIAIIQAPFGSLKVMRVLAAAVGLIGIYFVALGFIMSWMSEIAYYPILKMDLSDLGGAEYAKSVAKSTLTLPGLLLLVGLGFFLYAVFHGQNFWSRFFSWKPSWNLPFGSGKEVSNDDTTDVVLCIDEETKKPIKWLEVDQPTNLGVVGGVGSGKTTTVLLPIVAQFLLKPRVGVVAIEPKGDMVTPLAERSAAAGRVHFFIDPPNPNTPCYNPLIGDDEDVVAAINQSMLSALFGEQEEYFSLMQSTVARNLILLLKYLRGNDCDYLDFNRCLNDSGYTQDLVNELDRRMDANAGKYDPRSRLLIWFNNEYFGKGQQKIQDAINGLKALVDEIVSNRYLRRCIIGKSSFNMLDAIKNGYDIFVNTSDGLLGDKLSRMLGIMIMNHYQAAMQQRGTLPPGGEERKKFKLSVLCADEFGGYVTEDFGSYITKSRGYGGINILAFQNIGLLLNVGKGNNRAFQNTVLGQLRSIVIFGGLPFSDAKYFSDTFGKQEEEVIMTQSGVSRGRMSWFFPDSASEGSRSQMMEKEIYNPTEIMYLPEKRVYFRIMRMRSIQRPRIGMVDWFTRESSSIGSVYWFDEAEFDKELSRLQAKKEGGGSLSRLGLDFGRKSKEKAARELLGEISLDVVLQDERKVVDNAVPLRRFEIKGHESAFQFSDPYEEEPLDVNSGKAHTIPVGDAQRQTAILERTMNPEYMTLERLTPAMTSSDGKQEAAEADLFSLPRNTDETVRDKLPPLADIPQDANDIFNL